MISTRGYWTRSSGLGTFHLTTINLHILQMSAGVLVAGSLHLLKSYDPHRLYWKGRFFQSKQTPRRNCGVE